MWRAAGVAANHRRYVAMDRRLGHDAGRHPLTLVRRGGVRDTPAARPGRAGPPARAAGLFARAVGLPAIRPRRAVRDECVLVRRPAARRRTCGTRELRGSALDHAMVDAEQRAFTHAAGRFFDGRGPLGRDDGRPRRTLSRQSRAALAAAGAPAVTRCGRCSAAPASTWVASASTMHRPPSRRRDPRRAARWRGRGGRSPCRGTHESRAKRRGVSARRCRRCVRASVPPS